ncbi:MAG: excinuclease ABC subunit UvrC [Alphaproteobacteria bacterium]|nr:excinuclease ABC subunit UvrC [Alphaproteobacteria bacterium]
MTRKTHPSGAQIIESFVKTLPGLPGIYRMLNAAGDVLYVGKAKNLKKRVDSYTQPQKQPLRIQRMIAQTAHMEFATTHTETEALLLEANLIKKLKPRYNILLRDDKSFPYILITGDHDFPLVTKHRGAKTRKGEYFGPFASGSAVNETLAVLHKAFMLRNCPDSIFAERTRPCLQYQIKRCTAPCVAKVSREEYAKQVDMARQFLSGKSRKIQERLVREMQDASERRDFESAAGFRDRIRALTHIQSHQTVRFDGDIHALYQKDGLSCVQVFFFRGGQNFGNRAYFPRHETDETPEDILAAFIMQFYANKPVPEEILVNVNVSEKPVMAKALDTTLTRPVRGGKKELLDMAVKNAREALERKRATDASQSEILEKLAGHFGLDAPPERIEVYDNSHISGTHALGAMIVAGPEGFQKSSYRKFNMDNSGDDVGMMREMITRRFQPLLKDDTNAPWPDLLLIDGGQGQLNAVLQVMADLGVSDVPVVAIAKGPDRNAGRERFFIPGKPPFSLEPNDPVLYFLQRIRDEAHRFAITSHRAKRSKAIAANPLDEVPKIGAKRKKALLLHFGSAKAVAESGLADLQKVEGISKAMAKKIYDFFHE